MTASSSPTAAQARIDELYRRHYLALVRLAAQFVDDAESAEDVVQDVFAALHGRELPEQALPYLQRSVVNRSRSMLRRRRVSRAFAARAVPLELAEPADAGPLRDERRRAMLGAIDALPRRQREVIVLRFYTELSNPEIGDVLEISAQAVASALSRGLDALADRIGVPR